MFQSSFELTGYITEPDLYNIFEKIVSKLFRAYGLYNSYFDSSSAIDK